MNKLKILIIITTMLSFSLFAQDWQTNIDTAKTLAKKGNHNIILVFQGSDWCAPCIKLDKEIWSTTKFQELAKNHFVMLQADFPKRKKNQLSDSQTAHNSKLAEKYNPNGYFPYVVVLSPEGKVLGSIGYEKSTPENYFKKLTAFEK